MAQLDIEEENGIAQAVIESQLLHQQHLAHQNMVALNNNHNHDSETHSPCHGHHQHHHHHRFLSSEDEGEEGGEHEGVEEEDHRLRVMKSFGEIPLAEAGEMSISVSGAHHNPNGGRGSATDPASTSRGSPISGAELQQTQNEQQQQQHQQNQLDDSPALVGGARRELSQPLLLAPAEQQQHRHHSGSNRAGDDPDAVQSDGSNSLILPTHTRKRGSSVRLVMSPDAHMKSPRCRSPTQPSFDSASADMVPLELGKRLLEEEEAKEENA